MKLMRMILCMLLVIGMIFSLTGCFSGAGVDKDGNVTFKDKDGEVVIGSTKWDKSKMHGLDAPKAKLETSISSNEGIMYGFSGMKESDAKSYIEKLKDEGFTFNSVTLEDYSFLGTNSEGLTISFMYNKEDGQGTIMAGKAEPPSDDSSNSEVHIGTGKEWNSEEVGGLPDAGVVITSYTLAEDYTAYSFDGLSDPLNYIEVIKAAGYTVDASTSQYDDTYIYTGYNSEGDQINLITSDSGGSIMFSRHD